MAAALAGWSRAYGARECCAALTGTRRGHRLEVAAARFVPNLFRRPGRFAVRVRDLEAAVADGSMVGLYHSHPEGRTASVWDLASLGRTRWVWLIGGTAGGRFGFRAFARGAESSYELPVVVHPGGSPPVIPPRRGR